MNEKDVESGQREGRYGFSGEIVEPGIEWDNLHQVKPKLFTVIFRLKFGKNLWREQVTVFASAVNGNHYYYYYY